MNSLPQHLLFADLNEDQLRRVTANAVDFTISRWRAFVPPAATGTLFFSAENWRNQVISLYRPVVKKKSLN